MKCFIEIDKNNYVNSWSEENYTGNGIEVTLTDDTLYGLLDCVTYVNGALTLDEGKQKELQNTDEDEPNEIEQLQKETEKINEKIEKGQDDIATVGAAVAEIFEMLSNGGEEQDG